MSRILRAATLSCTLVALVIGLTPSAPAAHATRTLRGGVEGGTLRFSVTVPAAQASQPLDGRLLVMIAKIRARANRGSRSTTTSPAS